MTGKHQLPYPCLTQHTVHELSFLTDDALASSVGVYAGFTFRGGGVSKAPYDSLNLATHVNDNASDVQQNRQLLLDALGFSQAPLLVPNQVHGTNMVTVESCANATWINYVAQAQEGADGVIVTTANAATLLCFADCLPAIVVSPSGQFAVLHAGWRGALAGIVGKAIQRMQAQDKRRGNTFDASSYNLYIGPHICEECFEVSAEIAQQFSKTYGVAVLLDERHVNLAKAVQTDAQRAGLNAKRMIDAHQCTACKSDVLFSYRTSGGICGRQGAFGVRRNSNECR